MKKIGMRNIKTAIAVVLCIIILRLFKVKYPFYACIASVISMQSTVYNSFNAGKSRMIGTTIGATIGFLLATLCEGNVILVGLGIMLVIYLCNVVGSKKSTAIACIVFIAIMTNLKGTSPIQYSVGRLLETFLGIITAILVNYFVYPSNYVNNIDNECIDVLNNIINLFMKNVNLKKDLHDYNVKMLKKINDDICNLEAKLKAYSFELKNKNHHKRVDNYKNVLTLLKKAENLLNSMISIEKVCYLNKDNSIMIKQKLNLQTECAAINQSDNNSEIDIVYNYYVHNLIDIIDEINALVKN